MSTQAQFNLLLIDQPVHFLSLETFAKQLFSTVGAWREHLVLIFLREQETKNGGEKERYLGHWRTPCHSLLTRSLIPDLWPSGIAGPVLALTGSSELWAAYNVYPGLSFLGSERPLSPRLPFSCVLPSLINKAFHVAWFMLVNWLFRHSQRRLEDIIVCKIWNNYSVNLTPALTTFVEGQGQDQFIGNKDTSHLQRFLPILWFLKKNFFSYGLKWGVFLRLLLPFSFSLMKKKSCALYC